MAINRLGLLYLVMLMGNWRMRMIYSPLMWRQWLHLVEIAVLGHERARTVLVDVRIWKAACWLLSRRESSHLSTDRP
jgi:hypothetical protein